jgi:hypothetical protein
MEMNREREEETNFQTQGPSKECQSILGAFFCSTEESATIRSVVLLVAEDSLRASLFSAIKLDGRESRKVARLQRVNNATKPTKIFI